MLSERNELSGQERKKLWEAILGAYQQETDLKMMVSFELEENLNEIAQGENLKQVVFNLIEWAESQGKSEELVKAACEGNPGNPDLQNIRKELFPDFSEIITTRDKKCSAIAERWNELLPILSGIDLPLVSQVCSNTIKHLNENIDIAANYPKLANIRNLNIVKKVLLENPTPPETGARTIIEFVERLSNTVENEQKYKLYDWMKPVAKEYNIDLPSYQEKNSSTIPQYYLLVTAAPKGNNEFYLTAELRLDKETIPIDQLNYEQREINCKLDKISEKIHKFIKTFRKIYLKPKENNYNLIIELFMPLQHLDKNIDIQEIPAGFDQKIAIGNKYKFIIRCRERITEEDGDFLMPLRDKWNNWSNKFRYVPPKESYQRWDWVSCDLELLEHDWQKKENNICGINIICGLPEDEQVKRKLFISMIRAGVPICLWTRCNNLANIEKEFDQICTGELKSLNDLDCLLESVHKIRQEAYAKNDKENYLGYHLGFLCDNPYRIPSCLDLELIPTGE